MNARRNPDADPKHNAEAAASAPATPDADSPVSGLDALFGEQGAFNSRSDADVAAARQELAALFGQTEPSTEPKPSSDGMAADLDAIFGPRQPASEPADAADSRVPDAAPPAPSEPFEVAASDGTAGVAGESAATRTGRAAAAEEPATTRAGGVTAEPATAGAGWAAVAGEPTDGAAAQPVPVAAAAAAASAPARARQDPVDQDALGEASTDEDSIVLADTGEMFALFGVDDPDAEPAPIDVDGAFGADGADDEAPAVRAAAIAPTAARSLDPAAEPADDELDDPTVAFAPVASSAVLARDGRADVLAADDHTDVPADDDPADDLATEIAPTCRPRVPAPMSSRRTPAPTCSARRIAPLCSHRA